MASQEEKFGKKNLGYNTCNENNVCNGNMAKKSKGHKMKMPKVTKISKSKWIISLPR